MERRNGTLSPRESRDGKEVENRGIEEVEKEEEGFVGDRKI